MAADVLVGDFCGETFRRQGLGQPRLKQQADHVGAAGLPNQTHWRCRITSFIEPGTNYSFSLLLLSLTLEGIMLNVFAKRGLQCTKSIAGRQIRTSKVCYDC